MLVNIPRIVIAGLSGDSGKTTISCGLMAQFSYLKYKVAAFKKGPDYIDPSWHMLASGNNSRNLDLFLMDRKSVLKSFISNSNGMDIAIIEGNRGLYDGLDDMGTYSTAELSKVIKAPVIIVLNINKMTKTASAIIKGCQVLDKKVRISGVILNQSAGKRHSEVAKKSIENDCGIPVLGVIPRKGEADILPSRHLGLVTPFENKQSEIAIETMRRIIEDNVDVSKIYQIAKETEALNDYWGKEKKKQIGKGLKIAYFYDKAFCFYYPENLEALRSTGLELIPVSSFETKSLDGFDGLYIGGGFPETNIRELVHNKELMRDLKLKVEDGFPVYAECGGLMYLARKIEIDGISFEMSDILPIGIKMHKKPQGHGYVEALIDTDNKFFSKESILRGHEFHYSGIENQNELLPTIMKINKGSGAIGGRDGFIYKNVFASYVHIHSLSIKEWSINLVKIIKNYKNKKLSNIS
ncbi:MAG: hydrogenobyrinic acid a,c-diamide synthase (glutamine-hydrolyzing) [Candidatus Kapabacteria bacterium]|nr:hydrogenobyrinic acid a,c-diamide synthase (glutamine-hydrolyzing) [Candidatus Kapabacteria bacterium]